MVPRVAAGADCVVNTPFWFGEDFSATRISTGTPS
jgi:hypothetical protein